MNKIILIGNLTRDPETRTVSGYNGDTPVCSFTIAVNSRRQNRNQQSGQNGQEEAMFIRINVWGNRAAVAQQYLRKGNKVAVTGELQPPRTYQAQNGETRVSLDVRADDFEFLTPRNEGQTGGYSAPVEPIAAPTAQNNGFATQVGEDELPF